MNLQQQTIRNKVSISGVGLHTGQFVTMTFLPAMANHGIRFKRVDMEGKPEIPADCDLVTTVERGTTLDKNGAKVATVEHVLSALSGMEIDNVLIELDGMEIPIMDGSAKPFIDKLEEAGIEVLPEEREIFELRTNIYYKDEEKGVEMLAMPCSDYKITALIDFKSPVLGQQHASLDHISDFKNEFSHARTFCFLHELEMLMDNNLIKGGDLSNAIVVVDKQIEEKDIERLKKLFNKDEIRVVKEGILNNVDLRYGNEPARHKLLDIVGDLSLVGTPFRAQIIATKPGHKTNVEFAKKIKEYIRNAKKAVNVPDYDPDQEPIYDSRAIARFLPHRYPFLLVDKIIKLTKTEVVGVKSVSFNEPFFPGHFPDNPVMPGVLQIEAMAQTGGILAMGNYEDPSKYDTYFLKIDKAKFKHKVVPGDTLIMKLELMGPIRRGICEMKGTCYVGSKVVSEAELVASIVKKENV